MAQTCRLDTQKKQVLYQQAKPLDRFVYTWLLARLHKEYPAEHILYADESGISSKACYEYGWSKRGEPCQLARLGGRGERRNVLAAVPSHSPQAWLEPWVIKGSINRLVIEAWLSCLGQSLQQKHKVPQPYVLIWDNASMHLGGRIQTIARQFHIRIVTLPTYSPDLNPIEKSWAWLKHKVKRLLGQGRSLDEALDTALNM